MTTSNKTTNYNLYIRSFIRYKKGVCISGTPSRYLGIMMYDEEVVGTYKMELVEYLPQQQQQQR